jgi:hypothetical protein
MAKVDGGETVSSPSGALTARGKPGRRMSAQRPAISQLTAKGRLAAVILVLAATGAAVSPAIAATYSESEPNNTPASANGVVFGGDTWSGTLQADSDVDLFRLYVSQDTHITNLLVHLNAPAEFPTTGAVSVGVVDEHGVGSLETLKEGPGTSTYEAKEDILNGPGTYYVELAAPPGRGYGETYDFMLTTTPALLVAPLAPPTVHITALTPGPWPDHATVTFTKTGVERTPEAGFGVVATCTLDGNPLTNFLTPCVSPLTLIGLSPGSHTFAVSLTGYGSASDYVTWTAGTAGSQKPPLLTSKPKCRVPRLFGLTEKAAQKLLKKRACSLGAVKVKRRHRRHPARVVSQSVRAGKALPNAARINVTVR